MAALLQLWGRHCYGFCGLMGTNVVHTAMLYQSLQLTHPSKNDARILLANNQLTMTNTGDEPFRVCSGSGMHGLTKHAREGRR